MSDFRSFLYNGGVALGDLQDCMQLGMNWKLSPHPMHIGLLYGQEDLMDLDTANSSLAL
jgi:hypothetical protein